MSIFRSEQIEQPVNLSGSFIGSFSGSISGSITSASFASTASYIDGYVTNSIFNNFTSSYYTDSASFDYRIESILIPTGSGSSENPPVTVNAATTTILPRSPLYNNGSNGIGAFLSASVSGTLGNIDGVTLIVGDHFLVKNQSNSIQNGVYDVISTGSVSGYYILSRSLFSDETSELDSQIVIPSFGTTNRGGIFAQTTNNPVIGTDNIVYTQQTNTLITQTPAGTQAIYQIPWYTNSTRQLSKGSRNFRYINVTSGNTVTTSSLLLTGSFDISGSLNVTNGLTGSLLGTASYATTASYWSGSINNALSASFATTASHWSGSIDNALSSSYALTASYALNSAGGGGGGGASLSGLTAATATNIINNGNFKQEWQWNSLANNTGFKLSSTSGGLLNTQNRLLDVQMSGAMPGTGNSSYAGYFRNTQTGGSGIGLYAEGPVTAINAVGNINTSAGYYINNDFSLSNTAGGSTVKAASSSRLNLRGDNLINFQNIPGSINYASINNITDNVRQSLLFNGVYVGGQFYCSATTSAMVERSSDKLIFSANSGLTANTPFTPNNIMTVYGTNSNVGIGTTTPDASAKLEVSSTTSGFLPPRMTATQASAISSPAKSLMVYVTDTNGTFTSAGLWIYTTSWKLIIAE